MVKVSEAGMKEDADSTFIEQMVPHHEGSMFMADIALTKSEHQEIKELASQIKNHDTEELIQMDEFYKETYGKDVPGSLGTQPPGKRIGHIGMKGDIGEIENAKPFDKKFIEMMVPHHKIDIEISKKYLDKLNNQKIHEIAESVIKTHSKEVNQMQEWYNEWYGQRLD